MSWSACPCLQVRRCRWRAAASVAVGVHAAAHKHSLPDTHPRTGELPSGLDRVCFTWERGSKVLSTTAEAVNPHTHAAFFSQVLQQVGLWRCALSS
jgi:hypothetical protein